MGLFGGKKTYVSSTVYSLAGDPAKRPNFLKNAAIGYLLRENRQQAFSSLMTSSYSHGPGVRLRSFASWIDRGNYPAVGKSVSNISSRLEVQPDAIATAIDSPSGSDVNVQRAEAGVADYSSWSEQWMLKNRPSDIETGWSSDYDETSNQIRMTFEDGSTLSFTPENFDRTKTYVYVLYNLITGSQTGATTVGPVVSGPLPPTDGWTRKTYTSENRSMSLHTKVTKTSSYSDGRPNEVSTDETDRNESYAYLDATYERSVYNGADENGNVDRTTSTREQMSQKRNASKTSNQTTTTENTDIGGGVTKTTVTVTDRENLVVSQTSQVNKTQITNQTWSPAQLLIYQLGSGNQAIDDSVILDTTGGFYLPSIPVRVDNVMVDAQHYPETYEQNRQAYRKLTGSRKFDEEVVTPLKENESIGDIDYAFVVVGVPLNVRDNSAQKYLFNFFDRIRLTQSVTNTDYLRWADKTVQDVDANQSWIEWRMAQENPDDPRYGIDPPYLSSVSAIPSNEIRLRSSGSFASGYDVSITWQSIVRTTGSGLGVPGTKKGDVTIQSGSSTIFNLPAYSMGFELSVDPGGVEGIVMTYQKTATQWERLTIRGLSQKNYIYKGKFVEISAKEALADDEESGFLIPIHVDTLGAMSIVESTQLSMACTYMVLNSYKVVKKKFFQTGFFKILLVVAVVAVTVATGGAGAPSAGLLGTSAAVGASLGLAGTAALIAGAVANAIVGIIVTSIIMKGATAIFGDKLGAIIGAIAAIVTLEVGTAMSSGQTLSASFSSLARADNIIKMTSAVGGGISGYIRGDAMETMEKTRKVLEDYEKESKRISDMAFENGLTGDAVDSFTVLDALLDSSQTNLVEDVSLFLERTLMTGSDVAQFSLDMISNFGDLTISQNLMRG